MYIFNIYVCLRQCRYNVAVSKPTAAQFLALKKKERYM